MEHLDHLADLLNHFLGALFQLQQTREPLYKISFSQAPMKTLHIITNVILYFNENQKTPLNLTEDVRKASLYLKLPYI
jgi:hypothetical protein